MQHTAISKQLFTRVFSIYVIVAVLITSLQIIDEYNHTQADIKQEILNINETFKPAISTDLWTFHIDALNSLAQGMMKLDLVNGIEILDAQGAQVLSMGTAEQQALNANSHTLAFGKHHYQMDQYIKETNQRIVLGTLVIYSNHENVFNRVKYGILLIIISSLLKTTCLWLIFSFFIKKYLASPLLRFSEQINQVNFKNLNEQQIDIQNKDVNELSFLQDNFNGLLTKLSDSSSSLDKLNKELEAKVIERTSELKNSVRELIESKKMNALSILVDGMAHEINTPIGIARTGNSYLLENIKKIRDRLEQKDLSKQELIDFLESATESSMLVDKSTKKVGSLITHFKQIRGRLNEQSEVMVAELVNTILAAYASQLTLKNITISTRVDIDSPIKIDPSVIPQILSTFIDNSLEHGFQGAASGEIKCILSMENNILNIHYSDNGMGLKTLEEERVFDPFYTTNRGSHTGLGLNIIYNLVVTGLGGKISCSGENGLVLTVEFPINKPA